MNLHKNLFHYLTLLVLLTFFPVLFARQSAEADEPPIKLGSILILTGEGSSWGKASQNGIDLAIEKINAQGGVLGRSLVVNHQDDQGEPKKAISAFQQLTDGVGARFIIGPSWSRLGLPLIDLANRKKIVMISPTLGMAKFNESSPFLFNTRPHDHITSSKLADYVYKNGHRNIALVGAEEPWVKEQTEVFTARFKSLGGTIGFITEPNSGARDVRTDAFKISKMKDLDAFVSTTNGEIIGSLVAKVLKELQVTIPMYSVVLDQAAIDASQGGFEGLEFVSSSTPTPAFIQMYENRFKMAVDIGADSSYDAVMMLAHAIRQAASTDTSKVAEKLGEISKWSGMSGNLVADGKGGFTKDSVIMKVVNGKAVRKNDKGF